jgi:hypothetical protein
MARDIASSRDAKLLVAGTIAPTTEAALLEHHRLQQGLPSRAQRDEMENTAAVSRAAGA